MTASPLQGLPISATRCCQSDLLQLVFFVVSFRLKYQTEYYNHRYDFYADFRGFSLVMELVILIIHADPVKEIVLVLCRGKPAALLVMLACTFSLLLHAYHNNLFFNGI